MNKFQIFQFLSFHVHAFTEFERLFQHIFPDRQVDSHDSAMQWNQTRELAERLGVSIVRKGTKKTDVIILNQCFKIVRRT